MTNSNAPTPSGSRESTKSFHLEGVVPELITKVSVDSNRKLKSLIAYDGKALLGFSNGALQEFSTGQGTSSNDDAPLPTLVRVHREMTTKSIDSIALLKHLSKLVILSDGISIHDSKSIRLLQKLPETQGATTFTTITEQKGTEDEPALATKLLIACKRRLLTFDWDGSQFEKSLDTTLPDNICGISCFNLDKGLCALNSGAALVDLKLGKFGKVSLPNVASPYFSNWGFRNSKSVWLIAQVSPQSALIVRNGIAIFINSGGKLQRNPVQVWIEETPLGLYISNPYLVCVMKNRVEVRNPTTLSLLQTVDIPDVKHSNSDANACVATAGEVYLLRTSDMKAQIESLASAPGGLDEAASLLSYVDESLYEDKDLLLRDLKIQQATDLFAKKSYAQSMKLFIEAYGSPSFVIDLFPSAISGSTDDLIEAKRTMPKPNEVPGSPSHQTSERSRSSSPSVAKPPVNELYNQISALLSYLVDVRRKLALIKSGERHLVFQSTELPSNIYGDWEDAVNLVDTTLFKCYFLQNSPLISSLMRLPNRCDSDVVTSVLAQDSKWHELIEFYFSKRLHKSALELLGSLSKSKTSPPEFRKHWPTIRYLQRLDNADVDLVFSFAKGAIQEDYSYADELFFADTKESISFDWEQVYAFLKEMSLPLAIRYLEHVNGMIQENFEKLHTTLAIARIESLVTSHDSEEAETLVDFLKKTPRHYDADRVLSCFPSSSTSADMLEVRAILLGQRGDHAKALDIYALQLRDSLKAKAYCGDLYDRDSNAGRKALHILMSLYLSPPDVKLHRIDLALDLLASHGSRMSVVEIINSLPEATTIQDISIFLMSQVRDLKKQSALGETERSLRRVDLVKKQEMLLTKQQRSIVVTNLSTCQVCFKRLGISVLSVFPNNVATHYGCANRYQQELDDKDVSRQSIRRKKKTQ